MVSSVVTSWCHQWLHRGVTSGYIVLSLVITSWCHQSLHHGVISHYIMVSSVITSWCHQSLHHGVISHYIMVSPVVTSWCHQWLHSGAFSPERSSYSTDTISVTIGAVSLSTAATEGSVYCHTENNRVSLEVTVTMATIGFNIHAKAHEPNPN